MSSAEHRTIGLVPRAARRALVVGVLAAGVAAPAARADVVRLTTVPADEGPGTSTVSVRSLDGPATAPAAVTGLPRWVSELSRSPEGGRVAYAGTEYVDERSFRRAGLFGVGGGATVPFAGQDGKPLAVPRDDGNGASDVRAPWITWSPDGGALDLHAFDVAPTDPWFARPVVRRCDAATARCGAVRHEDAVALPGGGTVRIAAGLTAPVGGTRSLDPDFGDSAAVRLLREGARRRFSVRVRVTGRPGVTSSWSVSGRLRHGAPAYDRAYPSRAGVLVRLSTVASDSSSIEAGSGPAVIVRADGSLRPLAALPYDVVGTTPDGRWILAGGGEQPFPRPAAGEPLRTLDAEGRVRILRSGGRPITPIWVAHSLGLPDSRATESSVLRAGTDGATGPLVLAMETAESRTVGALDDDLLATVPLDGSGPPRAPFGVGAPKWWERTTTDLLG